MSALPASSNPGVAVVLELLKGAQQPEVVRRLVAADCTYVSLNDSNPALQRVMPWAGTHAAAGPQAVIDTFTRVNRFWRSDAFEVRQAFGEGDRVAVFGRFTYTSTVLQRSASSPFAVLAEVRDGRVCFMQFMEDTFATASTFRSGDASWTFHSDPDGSPVEL